MAQVYNCQPQSLSLRFRCCNRVHYATYHFWFSNCAGRSRSWSGGRRGQLKWLTAANCVKVSSDANPWHWRIDYAYDALSSCSCKCKLIRIFFCLLGFAVSGTEIEFYLASSGNCYTLLWDNEAWKATAEVPKGTQFPLGAPRLRLCLSHVDCFTATWPNCCRGCKKFMPTP